MSENGSRTATPSTSVKVALPSRSRRSAWPSSGSSGRVASQPAAPQVRHGAGRTRRVAEGEHDPVRQVERQRRRHRERAAGATPAAAPRFRPRRRRWSRSRRAPAGNRAASRRTPAAAAHGRPADRRAPGGAAAGSATSVCLYMDLLSTIAPRIHPCFTLIAECATTRSKGRRGWIRTGAGTAAVRRAFIGSAWAGPSMTQAASKAPHAIEGLQAMSSILTNTSAMVALQTLKATNKGMAKVQDEISTGLKVSTAKDNSSSWSIASTMTSDVGSYKKLGDSLTSASAMVGVARTAAEQVSGILKQIQEKVVQAENPDADARQAPGRGRRADRHDHLDRARRPSTTASTSCPPPALPQDITVSIIRERRRRPDARHVQRRGLEPRGARRGARWSAPTTPDADRHPDRHGEHRRRRPSVRPRPGSRRRTTSCRSRRTR